MIQPNGHTSGNGTTAKANSVSTAAWDKLQQYLPSRDTDTDFWWKYSGLHLALMLEEAEYPPEKQMAALIFFYHYGAPYMGPTPLTDNNKVNWKSLVQPDGTPIEYSWKWPQARGGAPEVRYDFEPISAQAGTESDPLCQLAAKELMGRLANNIKETTVDNTWFYHFMSTLFEHDSTKLMAAAARGEHISSTVLMAAEFVPKGVSFKTYIQPRLLGYPGVTPISVYEASIAGIEARTPARAAVHDFLRNSEEGKLMCPFSVGVDNRPGSRLKWYFNSPHTSFASVREILTLNGKVKSPHLERQLKDLDELIKAVLGLPEDFPETQHPAVFLKAKSPYNLPPPPPAPDAAGVDASTPVTFAPGYPYYFDVAPGQDLPGVKWSLPVRNYDIGDLRVAKAFTSWMEKQGRGAYCQRYMSLLARLAASKGQTLEDSKGLQEFISVMLKPDGEIDVTTYFAALAFSEADVRKSGDSPSPRRSTRRRGD
ncbi:dimethylallyl tryptophan synthase GliD1 [Xylariaceae sp. FL0255]|nr:dimethylallyl tryptophan synthase GliD1 [Xylariaceae sp. FL0255]